MNVVPALFYEGVVSYFFQKGPLLTGRELTGAFGKVASASYEKGFTHGIWVDNGRQLPVWLDNAGAYFNWEEKPIDLETASRKHFRYTSLIISADLPQYSTDTVGLQKVVRAVRGRPVLLALETSNISEEIGKCIESIQFCYCLQLATAITGEVLKIATSLARKNTLQLLEIEEDFEIEDQTTHLLVDLIKQEQFNKMLLPRNCFPTIKEMIRSWREENSEEISGKTVYCEDSFAGSGLFDEFGFEECTEDDVNDARRFYPFAAQWENISESHVLRSERGAKLYCFLRESLKFKTLLVFA